jgi:hypothetical protein
MKRTSLIGQRGCAISAVFVMTSPQDLDDSYTCTNASTYSVLMALADEHSTISASNRHYRLLLLHLARWHPVSQSCINPITNDVMEVTE